MLRRMKHPCVYILASHYHGTLYTGVTSDLIQRAWQHRNDCAEGFTKRYRVHDLVWYEIHDKKRGQSSVSRHELKNDTAPFFSAPRF